CTADTYLLFSAAFFKAGGVFLCFFPMSVYLVSSTSDDITERRCSPCLSVRSMDLAIICSYFWRSFARYASNSCSSISFRYLAYAAGVIFILVHCGRSLL